MVGARADPRLRQSTTTRMRDRPRRLVSNPSPPTPASLSPVEVPALSNNNALSLLQPLEPLHPILRKLLNRRPQLLTLHIEIIHRANPRNQLSRISAANSIHQRATNRAEIVRHLVASHNCFGLRETGEFVLAADVRCCGGVDDEVRGECAGVDLVVVGAVADEGCDHVGTLDGLNGCVNERKRRMRIEWADKEELDGAAEAGCCCSAVGLDTHCAFGWKRDVSAGHFGDCALVLFWDWLYVLSYAREVVSCKRMRHDFEHIYIFISESSEA